MVRLVKINMKKSKEILKIQQQLNKLFNTGLVEDGIYGKNTKIAIELGKAKLQQSGVSDDYFFNSLNYFYRNYNTFKDYFDTLYYEIEEFCEDKDYDPLILMAQFALETGYGKKIIPNSYNLGNIKAREGDPFIEIITHEYISGKKIKIKDKFKEYDSYYHFLVEYDNLVCKNARYIKACKNKNNPYLYFKGLYEGGYATDIKYIDKNLFIYGKFYEFFNGIY